MERYLYYCDNILKFCFCVLNTILYPLRYYIPNPVVVYGIIAFSTLIISEIYLIINYDRLIGSRLADSKYEYQIEYLNT